MPIPQIDLSRVPKEKLDEATQLLAELEKLRQSNPLEFFEPHQPNPLTGKSFQREFLAAWTAIVAAFCGNQAGKTTIGVIKALIQCLPRAYIPEHLLPFKQFEAPCHGWILLPTEEKVFDSIKPAFEKWTPPQAFKGGNWGKAFNGERMQLTFAIGSTINFKTYRQDPSTLGGATLHWVLFDEPPPRAHRDECATRLLQHNGPEWYTMTPLRTNTGWIRREIWRNREAPHVTVVKGSMRDNSQLSRDAVDRILASYASDIWRQAREHGDFMDAAGLVYADFEARRIDPWPADRVRKLEHIWSIDPGIRNAAIITGGFDHQGRLIVYGERLIQDGTPSEYAHAIREECDRWGIPQADISIVIDPAARQRSQATGDTVQTELARVGVNTITGQRDREAGQQQIRQRLQHHRMFIFKTCLGLADEADEFAWSMDDDEDDIGPADDSPYHRLAALRYLAMHRPWYPEVEARAAERDLGWQPGQALRGDQLRMPAQFNPFGPLS